MAIPEWPVEILAELAPRPAPAPQVVRASSAVRAKPYRVHEGLMRAVLTAEQGQRNTVLNWAAFRAREHVQAGVLDSHQIARDLMAAGLRIGLSEREVVATVRSGLGEVA